MKSVFYSVLSIGALSLSTSVFAGICDTTHGKNSLLKKLGYDDEYTYFDCRALPNTTNTSVVAVAEFDPDPQEETSGTYDLHLFKINSQTGAVITQYKKADSFVSDAVRVTGIALDTAAYQLNPNKRAIGVRVDSSGASRVYPYSSTLLNLYDVNAKKTVLSHLVVNLHRGENDADCNSDWEEHKGLLHLLTTKTQGYPDIRVSYSINTEGTVKKKGECMDLPAKQEKVSFVMKFDGKKYQVPKPFKDIYTY